MKTERKTFTDCKGNSFQVTVLTIGGKRPGPVITIISGQHGTEHSGPCFLPELAEELDQLDFTGTVHICPCANPGALAMDYKFYPEQEDLSLVKDDYYFRFRHNGDTPWGKSWKDMNTEYNMNRWNKTGTGLIYEITSWLWKNYVEPADLTLDIHGAQGSRPFIFNPFPKNKPLIAVTGIEIAEPRYSRTTGNSYNLTYQAANREGHYSFCIEFSVQHGLKDYEYPLGKNAVKNLMIKMGMLNAKPVLGPHPTYCLPEVQNEENATTLRASHFGHIRFFVEDCVPVKKGTLLYEIRDIQTLEVLERGTAPFDGIIWGKTLEPLAKPGEKLFYFYAPIELKAEF